MSTGSRVSAAADAVRERTSTNRGIGVATEVSKEGIETDSSVPFAGREIKEGAMPLRRIAVRISSIRLWAHPECFRGNQTQERQRDQKRWSCCFKPNY